MAAGEVTGICVTHRTNLTQRLVEYQHLPD